MTDNNETPERIDTELEEIIDRMEAEISEVFKGSAKLYREDLATPKAKAEDVTKALRQAGYLVPVSAVRRILSALENNQ